MAEPYIVLPCSHDYVTHHYIGSKTDTYPLSGRRCDEPTSLDPISLVAHISDVRLFRLHEWLEDVVAEVAREIEARTGEAA